jgi:hypothetical protein
MATSRNAKLGDMVLSMPGIRILRVEETATKPSSVTNGGSPAEDHDPAAKSRTAAPEHNTSEM